MLATFAFLATFCLTLTAAQLRISPLTFESHTTAVQRLYEFTPRMPPTAQPAPYTTTPEFQIANEGNSTPTTYNSATSQTTGPVPTLFTDTPSDAAPPTVTKTYVIPTEYLSQVPQNWPYTAYGAGRKKETATWALTDGDGRTVALVKHKVQWFPRPLRGEDDRLKGWRRTFVVPEEENGVADGTAV
ncbi:hypothetical protein E8E13_001429 [Curvularia kusanoi]|uniref:Uncharacterized protein n=1 Tax=Curvularia kusanoi TaxID=90978 RepID=A0A9P4W5A0_CURKU|nr:hypothetical protein E8E13_001429 [Curvularia kusanoi]